MDINLSQINWFPLYLSFKVAAISTILSLIIGITVAIILAKKEFIGKELVASIFTLPIIFPPTVIGYFLLVVFGRYSFIGQAYKALTGSFLIFTWQGAVIAAFIVSVPFLIRTVRASIESINPDIEKAARTLGLSEYQILIKITLPLAWRGIIAGVTLAFAKALGEFGATLMIAGNIPDKTQTMSIAIYDAIQSGDTSLASLMAVILSITAMLSLLVINKFSKGRF